MFHLSTLHTKITDAAIVKASFSDFGISVKVEADFRGYNELLRSPSKPNSSISSTQNTLLTKLLLKLNSKFYKMLTLN